MATCHRTYATVRQHVGSRFPRRADYVPVRQRVHAFLNFHRLTDQIGEHVEFLKFVCDAIIDNECDWTLYQLIDKYFHTIVPAADKQQVICSLVGSSLFNSLVDDTDETSFSSDALK